MPIGYDRITFIENDGILPSQFFPDCRVLSGGQRLLMAIFWEALETLHWTYAVRDQHKAATLWNAAASWVLSDEDRYASFVHCCQYLGVDHGVVREALRKRYGLELRVPIRQPYRNYPRKAKSPEVAA